MHERIRLPHLMIVIAVSATVLFVLLPFRPEPGLISVSYAVFVLLPLSAAFLLLLDNAWESYLEYLLAVASFYPPPCKKPGHAQGTAFKDIEAVHSFAAQKSHGINPNRAGPFVI